jgi:hypothetical protein
MKANKRIDWKQGMLITPETFIESDNYHQFHHEINRKLIIQNSYGLLPHSNFLIESVISDSNLEIKKIYCEAILKNGILILIDKSSSIPLPNLPTAVYYVFAKIAESLHFIRDEIPFIQTEYEFEIRSIKSVEELTDDNLFPILKITNESGSWEILDYIPPCITISSCRILVNLQDEIKRIANEIIVLISNKTYEPYLLYNLTMLFLELNNYSNNETPFVMVLLLKKIFKTILYCHPDLDNSAESFIQKEYDHNDIKKKLDQAFLFLEKYKEVLCFVQIDPPKAPEKEEEDVIMI